MIRLTIVTAVLTIFWTVCITKYYIRTECEIDVVKLEGNSVTIDYSLHLGKHDIKAQEVKKYVYDETAQKEYEGLQSEKSIACYHNVLFHTIKLEGTLWYLLLTLVIIHFILMSCFLTFITYFCVISDTRKEYSRLVEEGVINS